MTTTHTAAHPAPAGIDLDSIDANPLAPALKLALGSLALHDFDEAARIGALARKAALDAPAAPTDLSKRLRGYCTGTVVTLPSSDLHAAAEEIERYYGGMMAWKKTAEKKDRDWNAERMGRIDDRCAARAAHPIGQVSPAIGQPECGMCNDSGIVGFPPDQHEDCPDCRNARAPAPEAAHADDSIIHIAARIFDFKPHKQTDETKAKYERFADDVLAHAQQEAAPADWKMVPLEPTEEMLDAPLRDIVVQQHMRAFARRGLIRNYEAMIAAAPIYTISPSDEKGKADDTSAGGLTWNALALAVDEAEKHGLRGVSTFILRRLLERTKSHATSAADAKDAECNSLLMNAINARSVFSCAATSQPLREQALAGLSQAIDAAMAASRTGGSHG